MGVSATPASAETFPVIYIGVNFAPITSPPAFDYDFDSGTITASSATMSVQSTDNTFLALLSNPQPPDPPNGFGTFIGTAHPQRFGGVTAIYMQSACPTGYPVCFSDGSFTYGYMVLYNLRH